MESQTQSQRYPQISSADLAWNLAPVSDDMVNIMDRLSFIFSEPTLDPLVVEQDQSNEKRSESLKRKHGGTSSTSSRKGSKVARSATDSVDNNDDDNDVDSDDSEGDNGEIDSDDFDWKTMSQARRHFARKRAEEAKIPETPLGLTDIITAFRGSSECPARSAES